MTKKGIDVSVWQNNIDWARVKAFGTEFAMIRASYSTQGADRKFQQNIEGALRAGMPCGVYLYTLATTPQQARDEANFLLELIHPYQLEYPVAFDIEEPTIYGKMSSNDMTAIVKAFFDEMHTAEYYATLYSSVSMLNNKLNNSVIAKYDVWAAQWSDKCTSILPFGMWQYSAKGRVDGITGDVDLNYAYKDYPAVIKGAGLNGFAAESTLPQPPDQTDYKALYETQKRRADAAEQALLRIKQGAAAFYNDYLK